MKTLAAVLGAASLCCGMAFAVPAHASTTVGGPQEGTTGYYDYTPHGMRTSTTETEIWCGDTASHTVDTILEQQYNLSNWTVSVPERVAFQEGPTGSWDARFTCNPSNVIEGSFPNVLGDGVTYTYEVFYIGLPNGTPAVNQIGAAFSTDGLNWHKYLSPVETYPNLNCGCYGYSQPNATISNGLVSLYFEDNPDGTHVFHYVAYSTDGVHFTSPLTSVTNAGFSTAVKPNWGSLAYNPANLTYYALVGDGWRPAARTGGVQEQGDNGCTLYSTLDPLAGTWTALDTVDTNLTGYEVNFLCGFITDYSGNLAPGLLPSIKILASTSYPRPAYNASFTALGNSAAFNNWQISWDLYTPGNVWRTFKSVDHAGGYHENTTGYYDASYYNAPDSHVLGSLAEAPTGDATVPLYGCKAGTQDYFVSGNFGCENQYKLGLEGYAYSAPAPDRIALYRCIVPSKGHFITSDPNCEGQGFEALIGYSQS